MKVKVKRFDKSIGLPDYENMAGGFDFICRKGATFRPGEIKTVPANIAAEIPEGYVLLIIPRSSTSTRTGLIMPHSIGVVDPYYRGNDNEIVLLFQNISRKKTIVKRGDKLAQGLFIKVEKVDFVEVNNLSNNTRNKWKYKKRRKVD